MTAIPEATWQGSFQLFGVDVRCAVLSDGRRIIDADSFVDLLEAMAEPGANCAQADIDAFMRWQLGKE